jgi:hypothetical protein
MHRSSRIRGFALTTGHAAVAAVVTALFVGSAGTLRAQDATTNMGAADEERAALGWLEPAGGIVRLGLPSTPEASAP